MIDYTAYRRRLMRLNSKEAWVENSIAEMAQLSRQILVELTQALNGFSSLEAPALVAALDRYKAALLAAMDEDDNSAEIQRAADELSSTMQFTFVCLKNKGDLNAEQGTDR